MMVGSEKASRITCTLCNLGTNSVLCNVCESESREDFYLLMLTRLKDESDEYFGLQAKCIEMYDAIEHYRVPDAPMMMFDENVHNVDDHAKELLEQHTDIPVDKTVPVAVVGDGDC